MSAEAGTRHYLQWHITHLCNLRCTHCYQEEYGSHLPFDRFLAALDQYAAYLRDRGLSGQVNLTGGEPMLHPRLFDMIEAIRGEGLHWSLLTNGTLIDEDTALRLSMLMPVFVQVSLDGCREKHDAIRGAGNFEKALAGIDALKKAGIKVLVSFTAQQGNRGELRKLEKVCRRHFVDKLWWDRVVTDDPALFLSTPQFRRLVRTTAAVRRIDRLRGRKLILDNRRALQFLGERDCGGYRCSAGRDLLIFLANGDVMPCRRLPFVIGNLDKQPLGEILRAPLMKTLREAPLPDKCAGCRHADRCFGGAKCVTYARTGRLDLPDVNCRLGSQGGQVENRPGRAPF